jgi:hypothetical protein
VNKLYIRVSPLKVGPVLSKTSVNESTDHETKFKYLEKKQINIAFRKSKRENKVWKFIPSLTSIIILSLLFFTNKKTNISLLMHNVNEDLFFFLPRCSHTWERAPISEHRADYSVS